MEKVKNAAKNLSDPITDRYKSPNILRLTEITVGGEWETFEKCAEQKFLAEVNAETPQDEHSYDKIPRAFTSLSEWPDNTNLKCWSCGFNFDGRPKFVPMYITLKPESDLHGAGIEIGVKGNMCTFNCAELWIEVNCSNKEEKWKLQDNLLILYFIFTGKLISKIPPAPRITEHQMYGGELDHEAFWKKLRDLDPAFGLKNHTLGSTIAERNRIIGAEKVNEIALSLKQRGTTGAPMKPVKFKRAAKPTSAAVSAAASTAASAAVVKPAFAVAVSASVAVDDQLDDLLNDLLG